MSLASRLGGAISGRLNQLAVATERWLLNQQADRFGTTISWTGPTSAAARAQEYDDYVRSNMQPIPIPRAENAPRRR